MSKKVTKEEFEAALKIIKRYYKETLIHIKCNCSAQIRGVDDRCNSCGGKLMIDAIVVAEKWRRGNEQHIIHLHGQ